jgi:hypothetical protein
MPYQYHPGFTPNENNITKVRALIENMSEKGDIVSLRQQFNKVIFTLADLVNDMHIKDVRFPAWQEPLEGLFTKMIFHSASINKISEDVAMFRRMDGTVIGFPAISDLFVLSRAQLECYLTIHYLILSPTGDEEGIFRYLLYQLSGLQNRQQYDVTLEESKQKLEKEAKQIAELRKQVEAHPVFQTLDGTTKGKIKGNVPPARLFGWAELITQSHLLERAFKSVWKLHSNHAHSEYIGGIQLSSYIKDVPALRKQIYLSVEAAIMVACVMISDLLNLFPVLITDYEKSASEDDRAYISEFAMAGLKWDL